MRPYIEPPENQKQGLEPMSQGKPGTTLRLSIIGLGKLCQEAWDQMVGWV